MPALCRMIIRKLTLRGVKERCWFQQTLLERGRQRKRPFVENQTFTRASCRSDQSAANAKQSSLSSATCRADFFNLRYHDLRAGMHLGEVEVGVVLLQEPQRQLGVLLRHRPPRIPAAR